MKKQTNILTEIQKILIETEDLWQACLEEPQVILGEDERPVVVFLYIEEMRRMGT